MEEKRLKLSYDKTADVLYISFGNPQQAISEESEDGFLIRRSHASGEIIGVTVIDFEKRFSSRDATAILPILLERVKAA